MNDPRALAGLAVAMAGLFVAAMVAVAALMPDHRFDRAMDDMRVRQGHPPATERERFESRQVAQWTCEAIQDGWIANRADLSAWIAGQVESRDLPPDVTTGAAIAGLDTYCPSDAERLSTRDSLWP